MCIAVSLNGPSYSTARAIGRHVIKSVLLLMLTYQSLCVCRCHICAEPSRLKSGGLSGSSTIYLAEMSAVVSAISARTVPGFREPGDINVNAARDARFRLTARRVAGLADGGIT